MLMGLSFVVLDVLFLYWSSHMSRQARIDLEFVCE
jgi:hypothetical protein